MDRRYKMEHKDIILSVKNLKKYYPVKDSSFLHAEKSYVKAVDDVSFDIMRGETLGLVGESGCGKSTIGKQLAGLEKPTQGDILYEGKSLVHRKDSELRKIRTEVQMIFQDPYSSLNPRKHIYEILAAPMLYHKLQTKDTVDQRINELLEQVGLPKNAKNRYPHEFSGGQRQRITIAKALSLNPKLVICDEPVSALDVSIQAQILNLLRSLQKDMGLTYLFIAHGLGAVHYVSNRTAVMYLGKIVEIADSSVVFQSPKHPYSKALIETAPIPDPTLRNRSILLPEGEIPSAVNPPSGCRFHTRCPYATEMCARKEPAMERIQEADGSDHFAACFHLDKIQDGSASMVPRKERQFEPGLLDGQPNGELADEKGAAYNG